MCFVTEPNGRKLANNLLGVLIKSSGLSFQPFQPTPAPVPTPLAGWMNPSTVTHPAVSGGAIGLGAPSIPGGTSLSLTAEPQSSS